MTTHEPLFTVDLNRTIGAEYGAMVEDILRMVCIQLTIQVMLYFSGATAGVFTEDLLVLVTYIVLGVLFYWLVLKSLVSFQTKQPVD